MVLPGLGPLTLSRTRHWRVVGMLIPVLNTGHSMNEPLGPSIPFIYLRLVPRLNCTRAKFLAASPAFAPTVP